MKKIILSILALTGLLAGCATVPKDDITIETESDSRVNFSGYKTYAWLGSIDVLNDPHGHWKPPAFDADAEIVFLVDNALRQRGMSEVNNNPDMLVAYAAGVDMEAFKVKQNPETKLTSLENVPQAALVVMLFDPQTEFVTWAGIATGEMRNLDPGTAKKDWNTQ